MINNNVNGGYLNKVEKIIGKYMTIDNLIYKIFREGFLTCSDLLSGYLEEEAGIKEVEFNSKYYIDKYFESLITDVVYEGDELEDDILKYFPEIKELLKEFGEEFNKIETETDGNEDVEKHIEKMGNKLKDLEEDSLEECNLEECSLEEAIKYIKEYTEKLNVPVTTKENVRTDVDKTVEEIMKRVRKEIGKEIEEIVESNVEDMVKKAVGKMIENSKNSKSSRGNKDKGYKNKRKEIKVRVRKINGFD